MNTEVKNVIIATDGKAQYDTSAKRLLAQKNILAQDVYKRQIVRRLIALPSAF